MKRFLFLIAILIPFSYCLADQNKAYRALSDFTLRADIDGKREEVGKVLEGDTLFATEETYQFLNEVGDEGSRYIPLIHNNIRGNVDVRDIYPIKLESTDTIYHVHAKSPESRTFIERFLVPQMNFAVNLSYPILTWFWILVYSLCAGIVFAFLNYKTRYKTLSLLFLGVSLSAAAIAEIFYFLSTMNFTAWFMAPGIVGWGRAIINFLILSGVCAIQGGLYIVFCSRSMISPDSDSQLVLREDDDYKSDIEEISQTLQPLFVFAAYLPILLGFALLIMEWIDYFLDNTWSPVPYIVLFSLIGLAGIIGMIFKIINKEWLEAVIVPVCYIIGGVGITLLVALMGIMMIFALILAGIIVVALAFVIGLIFGHEKIIGSMPDGTEIKGYVDRFGRFRADDGKTYKIKKKK